MGNENISASGLPSCVRIALILGILNVSLLPCASAQAPKNGESNASSKTPGTTAAAHQTTHATFDFDRYTKNKPFHLNTLPTTSYGPPWADIVEKPSNFLECKSPKNVAIALCYYSGPGPTTPCLKDGLGIANCTCYEIPRENPYLVDINAILNRNVYLQTVAACGRDGSKCRSKERPEAPEAPVCDAISKNTLIPGADLISTFSLYLEKESVTGREPEFFIKPTSCTQPAAYAGCMTAPCKRPEKAEIDPKTHLPLVQCGCPVFTGPYQVGHIGQNQCALGGNYIWSAGYDPSPTPTPPNQ